MIITSFQNNNNPNNNLINNNYYLNNNNIDMIKINNNNMINNNQIINYAMMNMNKNQNKEILNPKKEFKKKVNKNKSKKNKEYFTPDGNTYNNVNIDNNIDNNNIDNNNNKFVSSNNLRENNANNTMNYLLKCERCKKEISLINKEIPLCNVCFRQRIFKSCLNNFQKLKELKLNSIFNHINLEYNSKKYYLDNLVEIYNINFEEKIEINKIKNNFENKKCIFSEYDSNIKYKLPCGCDLCYHFCEFFNTFPFKNRFICKCLKEYSRPLMLELGILFFSNKDIIHNQIISNKIIVYFNIRLSKNCCINNEPLKEDDKKLKNLIIQDNEKNLKSQNHNNFLSHLNHRICEKCFNSIPLSNGFYCLICGINHFFKKNNL